jgi:hypothetical protein
MRTPNDPRSAGVQQTAQPRSRRRFLTGMVVGGFLGSLLAGVSTYIHMRSQDLAGGSELDMVPAALGGREPMIQIWCKRASSLQQIGY